MTREEKLALLHSISFGAWPTVATMDMGLQYEYVTPEGYGCEFGAFGSWPAHKIYDVSAEAFERIKNKLRSGSLQKEDLEGTGLLRFYENVYSPFRPDSVPTVSELFKELLHVNINDDVVYALCDPLSWSPEAYFYSSYDEMAAAFIDRYQSYTEKWDDLDDEQLDNWIDSLEEVNGVELVEIHLNDMDEE